MADTDKEKLRAMMDAASAGLFALEEALGPHGDNDRREIYRVRLELGYTMDAIAKKRGLYKL